MTEAIVVALITGCLSLIGAIISSLSASRKNENIIRTSQAVTDTKLEELTREVREHNGFARRVPVLEERVDHLVSRVDNIENHQYHEHKKEN